MQLFYVRTDNFKMKVFPVAANVECRYRYNCWCDEIFALVMMIEQNCPLEVSIFQTH